MYYGDDLYARHAVLHVLLVAPKPLGGGDRGGRHQRHHFSNVPSQF